MEMASRKEGSPVSRFADRRVTGGLLAVATLAGVLAGPALASGAGAASFSDATAAVAVKAERGLTYGGSTSAKDPIVIGLSRDGSRVTRLSMQFSAKCTSGKEFPLFMGPQASFAIAKNGSFRGKQADTVDLGGGVSARETATLSARVKGLQLHGSSKLHAEVIDATGAVIDTCEQAVTFKAVASQGRVFAGVTSGRTPLVIELAGNGASVRHFHIGWRATCTPAGEFSVGDTLRNFPIVKGRFGDRFEDTSSGPEGQFKVAYSVRGKIVGPKATGTFRLTITRTDATGATTTCDTGPLTYKTTSG
jgi:hypothetical protein